MRAGGNDVPVLPIPGRVPRAPLSIVPRKAQGQRRHEQSWAGPHLTGPVACLLAVRFRWQRICLQCRKTWVWSLGGNSPLEKRMATHSSILAWRIPWTEEPGGLPSMGSQKVRHDWETKPSLSLAPEAMAQGQVRDGWVCLEQWTSMQRDGGPFLCPTPHHWRLTWSNLQLIPQDPPSNFSFRDHVSEEKANKKNKQINNKPEQQQPLK